MDEIKKVLASKDFIRAKRTSALLRYIVSQQLRLRPINESTIARELFGREHFEPQDDAIVRVAACRLRAKLNAYFEAEGVNDPVRIELPEGHYIPYFRFKNKGSEILGWGAKIPDARSAEEGTPECQSVPLDGPEASSRVDSSAISAETMTKGDDLLTAELRGHMEQSAVDRARPARSHIRHWAAYAGVAALILIGLGTMAAYRRAPMPRLIVARYLPLTDDGFTKEEGGPLLSDGARIYFKEQRPNGTTLAAVAVSGGATAPVKLPAGFVRIFDLSPLTSEVLAGRLAPGEQDYELWVVPLLGGAPKRIQYLRARDARWSPNRQEIAIALQQALYVANADGSELRKIAAVSGRPFSPSWSPDGRTIRFTEQRSPESGDIWQAMWEVGADGSNLHRLLPTWNNPPLACCGVWTPNGRFFIFQATRESRTDLWAVPEERGVFRRDSGSPVQLSSGLEGYSSPAVSADGKHVFAVGTEKRGELVRFDSTLGEFVPFLGGIDASWVTFSKSGRSVAYIEYPERTVWRANADGSNKSQVTFSPLQADGLSWSPDEKWLALRARMPGKPWNIYLVPVNGGNPEALIPAAREQGIPSWSPDGTRIAFGDVPPVHNEASGAESIHIVQLEDHTVSDLPGSRGLWTARWSPNGRSLSALAIEGERLLLYNFRTKKWRITQAENINNPTWSLDGKYIYFDSERGDRTLRRVRVADGQVDQLVDLQAYPDLPLGWSGVAPDNSPLILRNLGSTEVFSLLLDSR